MRAYDSFSSYNICVRLIASIYIETLSAGFSSVGTVDSYELGPLLLPTPDPVPA